MSCPFVLRYRSVDGPEHPPFDTSGRTVLNATWYEDVNKELSPSILYTSGSGFSLPEIFAERSQERCLPTFKKKCGAYLRPHLEATRRRHG